MAVVAVGDFEEPAMSRRSAQSSAGLARPSDAGARPALPIPDHDDTLVAVVKDKELTGTTWWCSRSCPPGRPTPGAATARP